MVSNRIVLLVKGGGANYDTGTPPLLSAMWSTYCHKFWYLCHVWSTHGSHFIQRSTKATRRNTSQFRSLARDRSGSYSTRSTRQPVGYNTYFTIRSAE